MSSRPRISDGEALAGASGGGDSLRGFVLYVGTATVLVAATFREILGHSVAVAVTGLWLLGPVAVILTTIPVLAWVFENGHDTAVVSHVSKWSAVGVVVLGSAGGLGQYVHYLQGNLQALPAIQVFEWACGGFVIGSVVGVYSASRRVRERQLRRERRKAENLAETLSVLNRVLRHDIRNNVNVVEGYVDLIAADANADDRVETVREHTGRIVELAEYARKTERVVAEGEACVETIDIVEPLTEICRETRSAFPDATVTTDFPERADVRAHRLVDSALENLVENAVEHHPDDPEVRVAVEHDGDSVAVVIADDGPGIPDSEVAVLESGTESALEHSNGMGLWLVNWIVTYSDGDVEFADNVPTGSEITVRLPAAADA